MLLVPLPHPTEEIPVLVSTTHFPLFFTGLLAVSLVNNALLGFMFLSLIEAEPFTWS